MPKKSTKSKMPASKLFLPRLLGSSKSAETFLENHWPGKPFITHGLSAQLPELTDLPFLKSLDAMLTSWPDLVQAHLPDVADEASSVEVTPFNAKKLFENRMGLLFNQVHKISPTLRTWLSGIHSELGLPAMTYSRCMVYATPDGKGTAPHFDQNVNFVLQLTGTKKWWLAPNTNVTHPSHRHTMGLPVYPELASYSQLPMPEKMPTKKAAFVLKPGSLLFVPQGYWHSTEATGEALSLNFTFSQPSWVDLFTTALRSRLLLSPDWRELADGVSSHNEERRHGAVQKLEALLQELTYDLPNWTAADILNATER